jgi:hypothetical protein
MLSFSASMMLMTSGAALLKPLWSM